MVRHHGNFVALCRAIMIVLFLLAATARWSISAVFPSSSSPPSSAQRTIEHGGIETNELIMTPMGHRTHHDSV